MKHKDRTSNLDLFTDICGYLSRGSGQNAEPLLLEAHAMVRDLPKGSATTRAAIISGDIELVRKVIDLHADQCLDSMNALSQEAFWNDFENYLIREEMIADLIPMLELAGANIDRFRSSFAKLARKAVLQDQPSLLRSLMQHCNPSEINVDDLLWESASILNTGPNCAKIVFHLIEDRYTCAAEWTAFFKSSISKGHHKSALIALKTGAVSTDAITASSSQDVLSNKARHRLAYFLGSKHRLLQLHSLMPDIEKILGMSAGSVGQMLDARLAPHC